MLNEYEAADQYACLSLFSAFRIVYDELSQLKATHALSKSDAEHAKKRRGQLYDEAHKKFGIPSYAVQAGVFYHLGKSIEFRDLADGFSQRQLKNEEQFRKLF